MPASAKVLFTNFSVWGLGERVGFSKTRKFYSRAKCSALSNSRKFSPAKVSGCIRYFLRAEVFGVVQFVQWESKHFIVLMAWHCNSLRVCEVGFSLEP